MIQSSIFGIENDRGLKITFTKSLVYGNNTDVSGVG
jgi:hypothetical protein